MAIVPQTEPLVYPPDEAHYYQYQPAALTERLDTYLPSQPWPLIAILLFIIAALLFSARAGFVFGYALGYAAGAIQPWIDARGWIALLFIAIGVPIYIIYRQNHLSQTGGF